MSNRLSPISISEGILTMSKEAQLQLITEPSAYFKELVTSAVGDLQVKVQPEVEFYLVNLLSQFMSTDNLFSRDGEGKTKDEPLYSMLQGALEEKQEPNRSLMFRQLGDTSLYVAGYFTESIHRKKLDVDYYVSMGGVAYGQLAELSDDRPLKNMYVELSDRFSDCVDVLSVVSEKTTGRTETDLFRLYDRWNKTGSERARRVLLEAGLISDDEDGKS